MSDDVVLGKLGPEGIFIFGDDSTIAARVDDDGTVRLSRGYTDMQAKAVAKLLYTSTSAAWTMDACIAEAKAALKGVGK